MKVLRLLSIVLVVIVSSFGCNVKKSSWDSSSVEATLVEKGYTLLEKQSRTDRANAFKGLSRVDTLSLETESQALIHLYLYQFESETAAIHASYPIFQSHQSPGNHIQSATNGRVVAIIKVDDKHSSDAEKLLELLKHV